jgi:integrase
LTAKLTEFSSTPVIGFGLRLRLGADGTVRKSWIAQYRHGRGTRRVLLGSADVLSAEAARQAAKKVLARVALGGDPQGERAERRSRDRVTLRSTIDEYLAVKAGRVRAKSLHEARRYLTDPGYFGPLHRMALDRVTRKDVAAQLLVITRQRGAVTAKLARAALSAAYSWALQMGLSEGGNPVVGTPTTEIKPREKVLTDAELKSIWLACGDSDFDKIIKLLILLGCRKAEAGGMAWLELALDDPQPSWRIPPERSKNGKAHVLPLAPAALKIIRTVAYRQGRDQLFGLSHPNGFSGWAFSKALLDAKSGVSGWRTHDIRRTTATRMLDANIAPPHVVEQILNHHSGHRRGSARPYNRSLYSVEVRQALSMWADYIHALVTDGERKVVSLPKKR